MTYVNSIHELIGNTPLMKINNFNLTNEVNIFAKLEFFNPGGSIKDRVGQWIIKNAEEMGELKKGMTIIEATAGNTGIGLALAAVNRGYNIKFVVPGKFSKEKKDIMKALGADIISTPTQKGLKGAFDEVERLKKELGNVFIPDQFNNMKNPEIHYLTTGPEIFEQLDGEIDFFVFGAGSGGTYSGIMKYLKEKNKNIKGILADPYGSILGGGDCSSYNIEGIGNDFIPETMDNRLVDDVIKVSDEEAFNAIKILAKKEGLLVGSSSGAAFYAALEVAKKIDRGNIVTLFADRSDRYLSQGIYNLNTI